MDKNVTKTKSNPLKIMLISGIVLRVIIFIINLIVGGHNCDEVMTSLNAFSLADRLTDINGERLPVYFDTWAIGGQSPFATYLTAFSVKLLGKNLFAVRLPALIFAILGFIALYCFAKEIFKDDRYILATVGLGAVSPWMLFSGAYVLDCNYLAHLLIFALLFFVKAVNGDKSVYYILSCIFFALCFYCYIASILIIPFILFALYLALIIKKKISIKNVIISVITVIVIALPFILWGLVITGMIKPFTALGFSFSEMPNYARSGDTVFAAGGILGIIVALFTNLLSAAMLLLFNDVSVMAWGSNIFLYGFLLSGIISLFGFIRLVSELLKKSKKLTFYAKLTAVGSLAGIIVFCAFVNEPHLGSLYRYGILSYLLIIFEAIGFVDIIELLKRKNFEKILCIYLALSFIMFSGVFAFAYIPQTKTATKESLIQENFGDRFFECMDFAKENGYGKVVIVKSKTTIMNPAAYSRYYAYGEKEFYSIEDELMGKNKDADEYGNILIATDGSIAYCRLDNMGELKDDFYIIETSNADKASYDKNEYKTKDFGFWTAVYREK